MDTDISAASHVDKARLNAQAMIHVKTVNDDKYNAVSQKAGPK
jgi:hypothetical protein